MNRWNVAAMNGRMTIGAAGEKRLLHRGVDQGPLVGALAVMAGMALHAEERLIDRQQVVVRRAVRVVAVGAVLGHVGMLVDKGSLLVHMALGTDGLDLHPFQVGRIR